MWGQVHVEHYMSDRRTYCHHLEHSRLFKLMAWVYLLKILDEFLYDPVFLLVYHTHCCEKQFSSFMISLLLLFLCIFVSL